MRGLAAGRSQGGAILLPSAAFATTGIVAGFFGLTIVALANAFTCDMLLWQTYKTGQSDYETLAFAIGGWPWRVRRHPDVYPCLL